MSAKKDGALLRPHQAKPFHVLLTNGDYDRLKQLAATAGVTAAEMLRSLIRKEPLTEGNAE